MSSEFNRPESRQWLSDGNDAN